MVLAALAVLAVDLLVLRADGPGTAFRSIMRRRRLRRLLGAIAWMLVLDGQTRVSCTACSSAIRSSGW